jgi:beta-galactosidase
MGFVGTVSAAPDRVTFGRDFAPAEGWVKAPELPYRQELCLNGSWQFQPMPLPKGWQRNTGVPPEMPLPDVARWENTLIKIPSPWNVNTWGAGRHVGEGTSHPYWPSSVYYPSYPPHWDGVEMGWLQRSFRVPDSWGKAHRIVLHFEAIGGEAQVFVNGQKAGEHFDRFLPFELDVTRLVKRDAENILLVGVKSMRLFDQKSARFKHMRTPYPPGSNTDMLTGIWQDVFLLALPPVRVAEVFVQPWVDRNVLAAEVILRNETDTRQVVNLLGTVQPWVNQAGTNILDAPEPRWRLDAPVLQVPTVRQELSPGESRVVTVSVPVSGQLQFWSPDSPHLYGLVLSLQTEGQTVDRNYTRFGWRQFRISGSDFLLNGQKLTMYGDLLHPFGPFVNSRRYVWSWYRMIKDMHGNAVRPHAQPHPRHYLELADEMGLLVLDETGMFGSSLQLNFEAPVAWDRYARHYDGLVRRDRNHPSVFGWSWGNELFAIFLYDSAITAEHKDQWYSQLAQLGLRSRALDPTRDWYSCDGDEDLRGTMPVWNKHFGHDLPRPEWFPKARTKPWMVGESGGSYYARPAQLAVFNGDGAFASYGGRNEALAIDLYQDIVQVARPKLAFFSPAETAWFGLEHLNLGYHDYSRLPGTNDGVWFPPFVEGKPGVQPERIPPYVCTFNPGWDPALPLYRPLAMFEAQKAAQAPDAPQPCPWDHRGDTNRPAPPPAPPRLERIGFAGAADAALRARLAQLGVPLALGTEPANLLVVDAASLTEGMLATTRQAMTATLAGGGTVWFQFPTTNAQVALVNQLLPAAVTLTTRRATALTVRQPHPWVAGRSLADLYFAEDPVDKEIIKCGLAGPLVQSGQVLLEAANVDWSLFVTAPENAKCAAVVLYEKLEKPPGAALVLVPRDQGRILVSTLEINPAVVSQVRLWRSLLAQWGVPLGEVGKVQPGGTGTKAHDLLLDGPPVK